MTDEEYIMNEGHAPEPVVIVAPVAAPTVETVEEDLDLVSEQVAVLDIQDEERHEQIMEVLSECREQLATLTNSSVATESPMLIQIQADLVTIKDQLAILTSERRNRLSSNSSNPPQSESTNPGTVQDLQSPEESTSVQSPVEGRAKKYRKI
jgi:hypothetical protein